MMTKIFIWFFVILNFFIFAVLPGMAFILYNEPPPIIYNKRDVLTREVPPGGTLRIEISADVSSKCTAKVFRTIIDGNGVPFDLGEGRRNIQTNYIVEVPIPLGAAPGMSYYSARVLWSCNIVQKWFPQEIQQRALPFLIEPSEGQLPMPGQQGIYQAPADNWEFTRIAPQ